MTSRKSTVEKRKKIALERIEILREMKKKKPDFEKRYNQLIKKLVEKYRLKKDF